MGSGKGISHESEESVRTYLESWGLQEFSDEASYYEWQRKVLSHEDLQALQILVEQRHGGENETADRQFYDLIAQPDFLPVIYSQRFDYFVKITQHISPRLSSSTHVLDFGCGVGILTCLFAQQHPEIQFIGVDRSIRSLEVARSEAERRRIGNVQFRELKKDAGWAVPGQYDCLLATQALLQQEREPGLPSESWRTFSRAFDLCQQDELEQRTGLHDRLQQLLPLLSPSGRLLCIEKTWNLGRRIFFQRALSRRGFFPLYQPVSCTYLELGEMRIDGPVFELSRTAISKSNLWDEEPPNIAGDTLYRCVGVTAERMARELSTDQIYENFGGKHKRFGKWTCQSGVWKESLAWASFETVSGDVGLMIAGEHEKHILCQLSERLRNLSEQHLDEFLRDCWGDFFETSNIDIVPGYENHLPSAQAIYGRLPGKILEQEQTFTDGHGREMHIELGTTSTLHYLYWANTFDQRQLLLVDRAGRSILEEYYQESIEAAMSPSA